MGDFTLASNGEVNFVATGDAGVVVGAATTNASVGDGSPGTNSWFGEGGASFTPLLVFTECCGL